MSLLLLVLGLGCSGKDELPPPPGGDGGDDTQIDADDTQTETTPDDTDTDTDTTDTADTSLPDTDTGDTTDDTGIPRVASLEEGGVVTCADPSARDAQPLALWSPGGDWGDQGWGYPDNAVAGAGVTVAELTGDALYDIVLSQWGQDQLYVGQADGSFADETATRWPSAPSNSAASTAVDIDGDGDLDLYVSNMEGNDYLLINDGTGHFADGTAAAGFASRDRRSFGSTFADMDGDGDLDAFMIDYLWCFGEGNPSDELEPDCDPEPEDVDPRSLWENQGDGSFVDVSDRLPHDALTESLMHTAVWIDLDSDGDQDLYLANDYIDVTLPWVQPNRLFLNNGDGTFEVAPDDTYAEIAVLSMGLGVGDLNGDEYPDLLISDNYKVTLLESLGPLQWFESSLSRGIGLGDSQEAGWGTLFADMDNDGDLDAPMVYGKIFPSDTLYEIQQQPDTIYLQGDDGQFSQVGDAWGFNDTQIARSLGVIDIDGDGWMELIRGALDAPATIHRSRCGAEGWLEVHLRDEATLNRYGIGARVRVTVGGESQIRWIQAGGTSIHTSLQPLAHFGVGGAASVDSVEVLWADGSADIFTDITPGQRVTVTRR